MSMGTSCSGNYTEQDSLATSAGTLFLRHLFRLWDGEQPRHLRHLPDPDLPFADADDAFLVFHQAGAICMEKFRGFRERRHGTLPRRLMRAALKL